MFFKPSQDWTTTITFWSQSTSVPIWCPLVPRPPTWVLWWTVLPIPWSLWASVPSERSVWPHHHVLLCLVLCPRDSWASWRAGLHGGPDPGQGGSGGCLSARLEISEHGVIFPHFSSQVVTVIRSVLWLLRGPSRVCLPAVTLDNILTWYCFLR